MSTRLVTGSIHVKALNTYCAPSLDVIVQGPTQSTCTSFHGATIACLGARWPYSLLPHLDFDFSQFMGQINDSHILYKPLG